MVTRSGTVPQTGDAGLHPHADGVLVVTGEGAGRGDHETDRQALRHHVEHRFDPGGLDAAHPGGDDDRVGPLERLGQEPFVTGRRIDDGDVVGLDAVEGLGEEPLGGRLDDLERLEDLVGGVLDPVGGAALGVGVDERHRAPVGAGDGGEVHRRGGLAHPALERRHDHDHAAP